MLLVLFVCTFGLNTHVRGIKIDSSFPIEVPSAAVSSDSKCPEDVYYPKIQTVIPEMTMEDQLNYIVNEGSAPPSKSVSFTLPFSNQQLTMDYSTERTRVVNGKIFTCEASGTGTVKCSCKLDMVSQSNKNSAPEPVSLCPKTDYRVEVTKTIPTSDQLMMQIMSGLTTAFNVEKVVFQNPLNSREETIPAKGMTNVNSGNALRVLTCESNDDNTSVYCRCQPI